jgi:hypothetical protein
MVGILVSGISLAYSVDARSYASCSIETAVLATELIRQEECVEVEGFEGRMRSNYDVLHDRSAANLRSCIDQSRTGSSTCFRAGWDFASRSPVSCSEHRAGLLERSCPKFYTQTAISKIIVPLI